MRVHELKSWPKLFSAIVAGDKRHELRRNEDRDFSVGDLIRLNEFDSDQDCYTGRTQLARITYITSSEFPCALSPGALAEGYCILSIELVTGNEVD